MRKLRNILFITAFFFWGVFSFAEDGSSYSNNFLLSAYLKAQKLRDVAMENIRKLEKEINNNKISINKAENIIRIARGRSDAKAKQAEHIATEALRDSKAALSKNEQTQNEWKLKKIRSENSLVTIRNLMSEKSGSSQKIKGLISDYTGKAEILKANGETVALDRNNPGFMEPGDKVQTWNGTAELQMFDGRGTARIGPYSEFAMRKDSPEEQVAELIKGKVYMAIDKVDEYIKKIKEEIGNYQKDIQKIGEWSEEYLKRLENKIERRFSVKTPTAVLGIRGTAYTIEVKDLNTVEIAVLKGAVEVHHIEGDNSLIVSEGYRIIAAKEGISPPQKIEIINKWWER